LATIEIRIGDKNSPGQTSLCMIRANPHKETTIEDKETTIEDKIKPNELNYNRA
jgi:hypothetical protein